MADSNSSEHYSLAEDLGQVIQSLAASGRVILPRSPDALLRSIVEAAARIFGARAASILLVNEADNMLEFKVTWGESDHDLTGMRIPIDQGIAGYVAMTGQPLAVSNVEQDARFNRDFAKSTGYIPRSILATPLIAGERVLGVMEVLDKLEAAAFGIQDIELLGLFAQQAALAIEQSQSYLHLDEAILQSLKNAVSTDPGIKSERLLEALSSVPEPGIRNDLLEMADLLHQFSRLGEAERKTCLKVLEAFGGYARSRRNFSGGVRHL